MLASFPNLRPIAYGGVSATVLVMVALMTFAPQGPRVTDLGPSRTASLGAEAERRLSHDRMQDAEVGFAADESAPMMPSELHAIAPAPRAEIGQERLPQGALAPAQSASRQGLARPAPVAGGACAAASCDQVEGFRPITVETERRYQTQPVGEPLLLSQPSRDRFANGDANPVRLTAEHPVSTFSIDVDTASYSFVRRSLMAGRLPPAEVVRIEEMINYFPYAYPGPEGAAPFAVHPVLMPTPWNPQTELLRIAIKGAAPPAEKPRTNLVFLIDTSGSMGAADKLPLVTNALRLLVDSLEPDDTIGIVTYAGRAGVALEPTPVAEDGRIRAALASLGAAGSTAGEAGINTAYRLAEDAFIEGGVNRVILATDGDFNVGVTDPSALQRLVERKRETGVMLSVLGFGQGNLNDALMQTLAQNGNGTAAHIDTLAEARKVLVEEVGSTLYPIANDVKIQIEFNPAEIAEYRLIGYETRALRRED
ncbi:MAG: von Willebrand factor type A domain-containing protein, partial [Pseudomonadota bacterium]